MRAFPSDYLLLGYGIVMRYNGHEKQLSQGYTLTTNNRMEISTVFCTVL
ncbi:MAG: hypothetical protein AAGK05_09325, partial [Pseudomonadota bacterium]